MSLPAGQQRVLNRIEDALSAGEPQLNSMYTMFARLSGGEPVAAERLVRKRQQWLRHGSSMYAIVLVPVMFAAVIVGALLGGSARGASVRTCDASYSVGGVSPLASKPSCSVPGKASAVKIAVRKAVIARLTCAAAESPGRFTTLAGRNRELPPSAVRSAADALGTC